MLSSFQDSNSKSRVYFKDALPWWDLDFIFLCLMLCEIMENHSCLPRFLALTAWFLASHCVLFTNCQMTQGQKGCKMQGLSYCTFLLPSVLASNPGCFVSSKLSICLPSRDKLNCRKLSSGFQAFNNYLCSTFQLFGLMLPTDKQTIWSKTQHQILDSSQCPSLFSGTLKSWLPWQLFDAFKYLFSNLLCTTLQLVVMGIYQEEKTLNKFKFLLLLFCKIIMPAHLNSNNVMYFIYHKHENSVTTTLK